MTPFLVWVLNRDNALSEFFGQSIVQCSVTTVGPEADPFDAAQSLPRISCIIRPRPVSHELLPDWFTDALADDSQPLDGLVPEIGALVGSY